MACDECRELSTHLFRSSDDLVYALRHASAEVERGVLTPLNTKEAKDLGDSGDEAMRSIREAHVLPDLVRYRFQCVVCGDRFELAADPSDGTGSWTREGEGVPES